MTTREWTPFQGPAPIPVPLDTFVDLKVQSDTGVHIVPGVEAMFPVGRLFPASDGRVFESYVKGDEDLPQWGENIIAYRLADHPKGDVTFRNARMTRLMTFDPSAPVGPVRRKETA